MTRPSVKNLILTAVAAAGFAAFLPSACAEEAKPKAAPLSPAFLQYLETVKTRGAADMLKTESGHWLGGIPSPLTAVAVSTSAAGPGMEICSLGEGETKVELVCGPDHKTAAGPEGIALGFEVKSADDMLDFVNEKEMEVTGGP